MKKINRIDLGCVIVPDGSGGFDFVVQSVDPQVKDPDETVEFEAADRAGWFDFSKVTAGLAYDKNGIVGRKVTTGVTVAQLISGVVSKVKAQSGVA